MKFIIGADECGTGSLCAQLVVCAVKAPTDWKLVGLNDSKQLTKKRREKMRDDLLPLVNSGTIKYHIAERSNSIIDEIGLAAALKSAYVEAFTSLYCDESHIIVDGNLKFTGLNIDHMSLESMVKADTKVSQVMAASILAKTYRDDVLTKLHTEYPHYGWNSNAGYASAAHKEGIKKHGFSPYHRKSYDIKIA